MEKTWNFVWNRLFDERTCMIYNFLVGDEIDAATNHLPLPEQIQNQVPNPGGYGTGMEDCMLNAGLLMDAVIARYEVTGEEEMRDYASKVFHGMELDATVSPQKGFLPRGVSPIDCKSHYSDTSRDQYTNWVYGAYRFYFSGLSDEKQKESIRSILTNISEKMEAEVIPENDWSFLREDGEIGWVGKMWGNIQPHEFLRLPMFYLVTWKITGNTHWRDQYFRYRDEALENTFKFIPLSGASYVGLQLTFSLRLVYDLDDDIVVRESCLAFMRKMTEPYAKMVCDQVDELMTPKGIEWLQIPYIGWREAKITYIGSRGGKEYNIPDTSMGREFEAYYPLRNVGEGMVIAAMCPDWEIHEEAVKKLHEMLAFVDYNKHHTCAPVALIEAYWLIERAYLAKTKS